MKELLVNFSQLEDGFVLCNEDMSAYFDTQTGETHLVFRELLSRLEEEDPDDPAETTGWESEEQLDLGRRILDGFGTRFHRVPGTSSRDGYRDMEEFIETVQDVHLSQLLQVAINGRGAFRRFKDVLLNFPDQRQRWFDFEQERLRERMREWLEEIGIKPIET